MVIDFPKGVRGVILPYPNGIKREFLFIFLYCKMVSHRIYSTWFASESMNIWVLHMLTDGCDYC